MVLENPRKEFEWTDQDFEIKKDNPLIYEAHIGMAGEEGKVSSYKEFENISCQEYKRRAMTQFNLWL